MRLSQAAYFLASMAGKSKPSYFLKHHPIFEKTATVETYNKAAHKAYCMEVWGKYCEGSASRWEMDSLSFYYNSHELDHVNKAKYGITDWNELPEDPVVVDTITRTKKDGTVTTWDKYQLYKIVGTVLDKNASKHYITLLTTRIKGQKNYIA